MSETRRFLEEELDLSLDQMPGNMVTSIYHEMFGPAALPDIRKPEDELLAIYDRMRQAIRAGQPVDFPRTQLPAWRRCLAAGGAGGRPRTCSPRWTRCTWAS